MITDEDLEQMAPAFGELAVGLRDDDQELAEVDAISALPDHGPSSGLSGFQAAESFPEIPGEILTAIRNQGGDR